MKNKATVGYEVFPDRFYSSVKKKNTLDWNIPVQYKDDGMHQYDFYGGDLKGIEQKINYLQSLGIDFLYLTPIFKADTNHRYDCTDFFTVDPMLGSEEDLRSLITTLHTNNIRLVLDGVFNHIGSNHEWFKDKKHHAFINKKKGEPLYWADVKGLPELNLDSVELRNILWNDEHSVVQKWTSLGVDDWRLDCAYDVGYTYLKELTASLKKKGDHLTIGEIWSYPKKWIGNGVLDGIMNYYFRELVKAVIENRLKGRTAVNTIKNTVQDCGLQSLLKCWNVMSSHDTPRVIKDFGKNWQLAVFLQFMLPGSPLIYYGEELGLESDGDPFCRQPMPWNLTETQNSVFNFYQTLISVFKNSEAINSGSFGNFDYDNSELVAFSRYTERIEDYRVIVVNPTDKKQDFHLITDESSLMNATMLIDEFSDQTCHISHSMIYGSVEPNAFHLFKLNTAIDSYSPYKRV